MLDVVNGLADGFVSLPVIEALHHAGILSALSHRAWTTSDLARAFRANEGHLGVTLRLLDSLGWVEAEGGDLYSLNETGSRLCAALGPEPREMMAQLPSALTGEEDRLAPWLERCAEGWGTDGHPSPLADVLDGALLAPVLVEVERRGGVAALETGSAPLGASATTALMRLFLRRGWATQDGPTARLDPEGRYLVDSGAKLSTVLSYWPMLRQMETLLFGAAASVFGVDANGHERHLDRRLNVIGSAAQHGTFFREMSDAVVAYFDSLPIEAQPTHMADLGCGDGSLLLRLYEAVVSRCERGQRLAQHPLTLIAADLNAVALDLADKILGGTPHLLIQADIGDPGAFVREIAARGVNPDGVLHVRSFVDHDRPLVPPRDEIGLERRRGVRDAGLHIDRASGPIPSAVAVQSLVEHLQRWRSAARTHGVLLLEVHCLRPLTVRRLRHETESLHFDAYHAISGQHLVEASTFLLAAAEAGFLPHAPAALRFPRFAGHTRITMNLFVAKPYRVRNATHADLEGLLSLEVAAVPANLRSSRDQVIRRITAFPEGQLLVEKDGSVIGAVYAQRITETGDLDRVTFATVESLHRDDGAIVQLLFLLVHPDQRAGLEPDDLLDFALDYFAVMDGVERVAGVTRCRDFTRRADRALNHAAYVSQRDSNRLPLDPILRMHVSHGARIERIIDGFRPGDDDNDGAGVLVAYDPDRRSADAPSEAAKEVNPTDREVAQRVRETIERVLGPARRHAYRNELPLMSMGLDSLDLMELRRMLGAALATNLDSTFFFRHGTPEAIIRRMREPAGPSTEAGAPTPAADAAEDGYAVIGVGCRFPGGAISPEAYWERLMLGFDAVREIPADRWDADRDFATDIGLDGASPGRWGGFLDTIDQFDPGFFRLSPREANHMDPQQRLLLETAWEALEDAGQMTPRLAGSATSVFIGAQSHSADYYMMQARERDRIDTYTATGTAHSILANRISFLLDLRGPSMAVDTACSSSLVAVHMACQSLRTGDSDLALAGGVNLMLTPDFLACLSKLEMMAPDGRCKTFDHRANGFVRGEGCGVVVLKRLADATRDGDPILAVIRGSAVNQDGASAGMTAPNGLAQEAVVSRALKAARLSSEAVGYVETHGTGTVLGDPVEVGALANVLRPGPRRGSPCVLGAVKTNIGHLEAAAGVAGLIKVVLSLQNEAIPGNLHLEALNPHLAEHAAAFVLPAEARPWPRCGTPRVAGVSSFGFGGTNAHVVLTEAPVSKAPVSQAPAASDGGPMLLPISARNEVALRQMAEAYIAFLTSQRGRSLAPADIAYTAARRRLHHDHRLCAVGVDASEWAASLQRQLDGAGAAPPGRDHDERRSGLEAAAKDFVVGIDLDWARLFPREGRCIQSPRYPWQRQRYWLAPRAAKAVSQSPRVRGSRRIDAAPTDWFYDLKWRPRSRLGDEGQMTSALSGVDLGATAAGLAARIQERGDGGPTVATLRATLDDLSAGYIWSALGALGAARQAGAVWPKATLRGALGVLPRFDRLLHRMAEILIASDVLRDQDRNWLVLSPPSGAAGGAVPSDVPGLGDVAGLQARCGAHLASVLRGDTEPLSLLFADDGAASAEAIYRDAPPSIRGNQTLAAAVEAWLASVPDDRTLRILEIGAGTGATTSAVLPVLPRDRCEYVFTDVSPAFLRRGETQFADEGCLRFKTLDLEQPPSRQGFGPSQFDLVIAVNVLHATQDLRSSLGHIGALLADNGVLALLECTSPQSWMDISFGLTDGWWRFADVDLRATHPLLREDQWIGLLGRSGFADSCALPLQGAAGDPLFDQSLIFARKPAVAERRDTAPARDGVDRRRYVIFDDASGLGEALLREVKIRGADGLLIEGWRDAPSKTGGRVGAPGAGRETVVYLAGTADIDLLAATAKPLGVIQAVLDRPAPPEGGLWLVTQGGQAVGPISSSVLSQSLLWGLGRCAALEAPALRPTLIDLDPATPPPARVAALLDEIENGDTEDQVVLRGDARYAPRLERITRAGPDTPPLRLSGRHLITGGLGALGSLTALQLARAGADELVLIVNRPLPDRATWANVPPGDEAGQRIDTVRALEAMGAKVMIEALDLADGESLAALFRSEVIMGAPLQGVWHAAMSFSAHPISELDREAVRRMIRVKADAAVKLHELTVDHPIKQFVLFSSTTALWGARGLAHYAAANACLDALAHLRRAQGRTATVINWGVWDATRSLSAAQKGQAHDVGLRPMPAPAAFAALARVLASGSTQTIVADVDWSRFKPAYEAQRVRPLLSSPGLDAAGSVAGQAKSDAKQRRSGVGQRQDGGEALAHRLASAPADERVEILTSSVRKAVAAVLGLASDARLDPRTGFFELGMDSLTAVQLRRRLEVSFERTLPSTLAFKYPTVEALVTYLSDALFPQTKTPEEPVIVDRRPTPWRRPPYVNVQAFDEGGETEDELFARLAARLAPLPVG
jgi:polyketide synthase PksN